MKFRINSLLFVGSIVLCGNSFAGSNGEIVQKLYNGASEPATSEDFPQRYFGSGEFLSPPANLCIVLDGTDQPYGYDISRTTRITHADGPLLPEKREEKLVFGNTATSFNLVPEPMVQGPDLVLSNPIYTTWISSEDGVKHFVPAQLFARKSDQYIAFKVIVDHSSQNVRDGVFYGYCFPRSGLPLF